MSSLWKWGMIIMLSFGLLTQHQDAMMTSFMEVGNQTFDLVKNIVLTSCLWSGFLNIAKESGLLHRISRYLNPLWSFIYRNPMREKTKDLISHNFMANLLGMGSLATLSGLEAMTSMKEEQKSDKASRNMLTLVLMNTTGLSLIPTTILALRQSYHSQQVSEFVIYMIGIGVVVMTLGLLIQRLIDRG